MIDKCRISSTISAEMLSWVGDSRNYASIPVYLDLVWFTTCAGGVDETAQCPDWAGQAGAGTE